MKFFTFIFCLVLSYSVFAQESNLDNLNAYFLKDNLTERNRSYRDHYKNLIPNELCEKFFGIKFNICEKVAFSIELIENKYFNTYIVGRPCCAGGYCEWETLFTLDKQGNLIDKFRYSEHFISLIEDDELKGSIRDNVIITVETNQRYDDSGDSLISERITKKYYQIDSLGYVCKLNENIKTSKNRKYPFSSGRFVTDSELKNMRSLDLAIMRNEIYASYGYSFKTEKWQEYFKQFDWYMPLNENEKINDRLNAVEKVNVKLIVAEEKKREK